MNIVMICCKKIRQRCCNKASLSYLCIDSLQKSSVILRKGILSLIRQAALSFTRIIVGSVPTAVLSAVAVLIAWVPVNTTIRAVVSTEFAARDFDFVFLVFIFNAPLNNCDFIFMNVNSIPLANCFERYQCYIRKNDWKI